MNQIKIPSHWSWRAVRELGTSGKPTVKAGPFGSALKKEFYVDSGFRVYGQEQVIAGDLSIGNYYISPDKFRTLKSCEVAAGDILVSLVGSFGKILVVPDIFEPGIINPRLVRLSLDPEIITPSFFSYFFRSPSAISQMELKSHGGTMGIINAKNIADLFVPIPPIDQQKRIAAILDKAEELRRLRRQSIEHLDVLSRSIFIEMFGDPAINRKGWVIKSIGELASKFSDGPFGSNLKTSHYTETGIRVIRLQNIGIGEFLDKGKAYISREHFNTIKKHECIPGDVLVGTLGDPNLRACIQPEWLSIALNKADCVQLRANSKITCAAYICALLNQPSVEKMAEEFIVGETRTRISMGRLRKLKVPLPPLSLQQEFAQRIEAIESLKAKHRKSLTHLDTLFASLQHRAFRGEL
jgi:type I restriction enzyme, S subunit